MTSTKKSKPIPIFNAAAFTVLYFQQQGPKLHILNSHFSYNIGCRAGAILILHYYTNTYKLTGKPSVIRGSVFEGNEHYDLLTCAGSAISFIMFYQSRHHYDMHTCSNINHGNKVLLIQDSKFRNHNQPIKYEMNDKDYGQNGILFIGIITPPWYMHIIINLSRLTFLNNSIENPSSLSFVTQYKYANDLLCRVLNVTMYSIQVLHSRIVAPHGSRTCTSGIFKFDDVGNVSLIGLESYPANFSYNRGSCILLYNSNIYLKGKIVFGHNVGHRGAALALFQQSVIYVADTLNAVFRNNFVDVAGGAIYAQGIGVYVNEMCTFQLSSTQMQQQSLSPKMKFINNTAVQSGNAIYSTSIYQCFINNDIQNIQTLVHVYKELFKFSNQVSKQLTLNELSTVPSQLILCKKRMHIPNVVYPGQSMLLSVGSLDRNNSRAYTTVTIALAFYHNNSKEVSLSSNYSIRLSDGEQVITETSTCTDFNVTVVCSDEQYELSGNRNGNPTLLFYSTEDLCSNYYDLPNTKFSKCPLGFILNSSLGICTCSHAIRVFSRENHVQMICNINQNIISRKYQWAGSLTVEYPKGKRTTTFGISRSFLNYDLFETGESVFYMNTSGVYIASVDGKYPRPICYHTRSGPLCGGCKKEHGKSTSVMFGSIKCGTCSSLWLWTIPLYAIAGLMLVVVLFKLRLTLTNGTLNAVIFYAHAANIGIMQGFQYITDEKVVWPFVSILKVFLSMLNLNLGFPLCFFHEMDELWKAGLSLLFPMYLLMIILAIACVSHFSVRLSNDISQSSIQVIVTIVHLSFVKLLSALNDVFAYTIVYIDIETMPPLHLWLHDGNIIYGKRHHLILMIVTSVTVAIFILPYFLILIGGRYVLRYRYFNKYLRPFHEAIHAPYKDNKYYWFTVRLLLIIYMYLCYIVYFGTDNIYAAYAFSASGFNYFHYTQCIHKTIQVKAHQLHGLVR